MQKNQKNEQDNLENSLSKTKLKAIAEAEQAIGVKLIALPNSKLNSLNLPERLLDAVQEAKRITSNGALRRQRQYIGTLMREMDVAPILEQFEKWEGKNREQNAFFHSLERWRDRLIEDESALSELIQSHPQINSQQIRTLIRNARKEANENKPPKSRRELFKQLREILGDQQDGSIDEDTIEA
jgi:ribosome-associated protein